MQMRQLGAGGPEISVVGFGSWEAGGMHWGPNSSEQDVIAAIHVGPDAGMTWVDTAEVYGDGVSERIVGRAVAGRDDVLVFTKVAPDEGSGLAPDHEFSDGDWRSGRGKYASWRDEEDGEWPFDPEPMARGAALVDRMRPLAERDGATVAQLALRWALEQTGVTAVIAGSRNPAHAAANAAAGS